MLSSAPRRSCVHSNPCERVLAPLLKCCRYPSRRRWQLSSRTLLALSQANLTGNYTVLRELGSPEFQNANTSAKLAMVFAGPREQKLDLTFVVLATPQLSEPPRLDEKGTLRVVGYYPTRPLQVNFDLSFQAVAGTWRHSEIALAAGPPVLRMLPPRPLADAPQHPEQGKQPQGRVVPAGRK